MSACNPNWNTDPTAAEQALAAARTAGRQALMSDAIAAEH